MLKIEFTTNGAAFEDEYTETTWDKMYHRNEEVKRVLKNICNQLDNGKTYGACMDINGNKVGEWSID